MRPRVEAAVLLALWASAAGCRGEEPGGGREGLLAADSAAAGRMLYETLAEEAWYLAPGRPIMSRREVVSRGENDAPEGRVQRIPLVAGVSSDGSHGYTAGRVVEHGVSGTGAIHGKYLAYWRHAPDTGWRIWAYVESASPAAPDTVPAAAARAHAAQPAAAARQAGGPDRLIAADSAFSARSAASGAAHAFGEYAEPQALTLLGAGHGMVWGDSAIGAYFREAIPAGDALTWTPRLARLAPSGDLGFTIGDAAYRHVPADGAEQYSYTKYLTVWRRQADGSWRYAADGGNAQPAPGDTVGRMRAGR